MAGFPLALTTRLSGEPGNRRVARRWKAALNRDLRPVSVLLAMLITRLLIAWKWVQIEELGLGDVLYYWSRTADMATVPLAETMREYPTPAVWLLSVPQWLGGGSEWGYTGWFVGLVLVADLGFCALIWLTAARWRGWAVVVWSVLCALLGPLVWLRFDLLPAVLAGAALLLVARRPCTAGGLLAVGAGTKLWPGILFPLLVNRPDGIRHRDWFSASIGFGVTGVVLVIGSLVTGGWARLFSPLVWQSDRGLQIESVPATVLMGLRAVDPQAWHITVSRYQAFEIFGPGVDAWLTVSDIASLVGLALGVWILIVHWRRRYADRQTWATAATVATLAYLLLFIVTNKTLSPQYVIWLGGPIAVLIAWHGLRTHRAGLPLLRWTSLVLATAALTHVVYPILYDRVNGMADDAVGTPVATVVLVLRNLLLVVLTIDVVRHAVNPRADLPSSGRFGYARVKV